MQMRNVGGGEYVSPNHTILACQTGAAIDCAYEIYRAVHG